VFFRKRIYLNKVISKAEEMVLGTLGKQRGSDAMALIASAMAGLEENSKFISNVVEEYRKADHPHDMAALRLIHLLVEKTREVISRNQFDSAQEGDDILARLASLDEVIDAFAAQNADRVRENFMRSNTDYAKGVIERAHSLIESTLGEDRAQQGKVFFKTMLEKEIEVGRLTPEIFNHLRGTSNSLDDAAIALIDGLITSIKNIFKATKRENPFFGQMLMLEDVIDNYIRKSPPNFLPRNGRFAEQAEKVGLDKFFKTEKLSKK